MPLPGRRTCTLLPLLALAASVLAGVPGSLAGGSEVGPRTGTAIAAAPEASAAFRRPADVLRARTAARSAAAAAPRQATVRAGSTSFAFSALLDGRPVRWNPCAPIRWTANVSRGPANGLAVLSRAVARISAVTGTTWQYVGTSTAVPTSRYLPTGPQAAYAPVLLGWTDADESDLLAGQHSNVLGMARTAWFGVAAADGSRHAATRAGVVALDRTDRLASQGPGSWEVVALHELGHVMGLDHVGDRTQLMASTLPAISDLQPGDQAGLRALGRAAGCVVVP